MFRSPFPSIKLYCEATVTAWHMTMLFEDDDPQLKWIFVNAQLEYMEAQKLVDEDDLLDVLTGVLRSQLSLAQITAKKVVAEGLAQDAPVERLLALASTNQVSTSHVL